MFVFLPSQARARSHAAARLAQSCPGRILLRARRAWPCLPSRGRPCDGPGFVPVNRGRPSARSAELQAIHRRPLQNPWSPLHKAPPNPTCKQSTVRRTIPPDLVFLREPQRARAIQRVAKEEFPTRAYLEFHLLVVMLFCLRGAEKMHSRAHRMSVRRSHVHGSKMA